MTPIGQQFAAKMARGKVSLGAGFLILAGLLAATTTQAQVPDGRTLDFAKTFSDHCLTHFTDLQALRAKLNKTYNKVSHPQAASFLSGNEGDVWYVPSIANQGNMVLSIWAKQNYCTLFARRAALSDTQSLFRLLAAQAPPPLVSALQDNGWTGEGEEKRHTLTYLWSEPNHSRQILLTLTTSESDRASVQALASVLVINPH